MRANSGIGFSWSSTRKSIMRSVWPPVPDFSRTTRIAPAGFFGGFQSRHQAPRQRPLRLLERGRHVVHVFFAGEDVALAGVILAGLAPCPGVAALAGERRGIPLGIDHADLTDRLPLVRV